MDTDDRQDPPPAEVLIEQWLPIEELGVESRRENSTGQHPPLNRLHVWWARRPLTVSRAAILVSLLPAYPEEDTETGRGGDKETRPWPAKFRKRFPTFNDYKAWFLRLIGIQGDAVVASVVLKATLDYPARFGPKLIEDIQKYGKLWVQEVQQRLSPFYTDLPKDAIGGIKKQREFPFRVSTAADVVAHDLAIKELKKRRAAWETGNLIPSEPRREGRADWACEIYGATHWSDTYSPRQLLAMVTLVECLHHVIGQAAREIGQERAEAVQVYLSIALDKAADYNSRQIRWDSTRDKVVNSFARHDLSLQRRLDYLKGEATGWLTDDDLDQEDLEADVTEAILFDDEEKAPAEVPALFLGEIQYVDDFLTDLRALGTDSKFEQLAHDLADVLKRRDSVLVFTQYTDTMDYLRGKLRHVYGAQVACYSGRGGELWDGERWIGTSKENIKTAFREQQDIKILLCTESASEGLNLQTCGVLINFDLPWNPMRVEQRIGRIDRIGQVYPDVWIRNYFYEDTVEADVYHRLDDRITSFESVVGELQPILSQVARVIEAAAMANDKKRGELIAQEVEEINRRFRSAETSALNLDKFVDDTVEAAADVPPPVTLPELERAIEESGAMRGRFDPHPEIAGAHLLDWHGAYQAVTFNPDLFDQHPNTLRLPRPPTATCSTRRTCPWTSRTKPMSG